LEKKNDGVMDDKSGEDDHDTREMRWSWRRDRSRRGWPSEWRSWLASIIAVNGGRVEHCIQVFNMTALHCND